MSGTDQAAPAIKAPHTLPLKHPVELKNAQDQVVERIDHLVMHRFKGADVRKILNAKGKGEGDMAAQMVICSARIPPSTYDLLDAEDLTAASEIAAVFFGASLTTGPT